jgi:two-component system sensor histidine kinase EvgS
LRPAVSRVGRLIACTALAAALCACPGAGHHAAPPSLAWSSHVSLLPAEKAYLESLPPLRVGVDPKWAPIAFVDAQGRIDGISADYLDFLSDALHLRFKLVPTRSWAETIRLANAGRIDIVIAASPFDGLAPGFALSNPYVRYPLVIVTRETAPFIGGLEDLEGAEVALVGDVQTAHVRLPALPKVHVFTVGSAEDGLKAVAQGRAFAYIGNLGVIDRIVRERYAGTLRVAAPADRVQDLSFGIAPPLAPLVPLVDRVLAAVPETEREYIQNSWLSTRFTFGVAPRTLWLILAPVGTLTLLFLAVQWFNLARLRDEVRQRRRTERDLLSETRFKTLLMDTVPIPVCVEDGQERIVAVNPAYEQAVGARAEALIGKTRAPSDRARDSNGQTLARVTRTVIETGDPAQGEVRYRGPDGRQHEAVYWARPCTIDDDRPAVLYAFVDVSDLRRMERRELELKRRLVELTQALPSVVFQLRLMRERRPSFELLFANRRANELIGARQREPVDAFAIFARTLDPFQRHRLTRLFLRSARSNEPVRAEFPLYGKGVGQAWFHVEAAPRADDDGGTQWSGYLHDVTEAKQAQAALMAAKHEAEDEARARELLIATVSHEIRLPMSGIVSILQLLDHEGLLLDDRNLVGMASDAAQSLLLILNDILDFAKSENGELALEHASMSIGDIVGHAAALVGPEVERKRLTLHAEVSPAVASRHVGDARRLGQVLLNVLGNAVKFTDRGSVSLLVDVVEQAFDRQLLSMRVVDTGIGIGPDDQARLFSPFSQARATSGSAYGGTGLGLAICKRLVEQMGGTIALDSKLGRGTTIAITLSLPVDREVVRPAASPGRTHSNVASAGDGGALQESRILLVEDRPINREVLRRQLARLSIGACDLAENGADALSACEQRDYAMIITDCAMPVLGGAELIARLRERERGGAHRTVLVALTADATPHQRAACLAAGADEVFVKPLSLERLRDLLGRYRLPVVRPESIENVGLPIEQQEDLWRELHRTLVADMDRLRGLSLDKDRDRARAREIAHSIAGTAAWFQLRDVSEAATRLDRSLGEDGASQGALRELQLSIERTIGAAIHRGDFKRR